MAVYRRMYFYGFFPYGWRAVLLPHLFFWEYTGGSIHTMSSSHPFYALVLSGLHVQQTSLLVRVL
jgi:hypothetical protein